MSSSVDALRGTARLLTRVIVVPLLVVLVVGAFVVTAKALAVREAGAGVTETTRSVGEPPWKDSYSRRFPGCVPAVLWPARETPAAVIVQWDPRGDQRVERVERGAALRRTLSADSGTGRIIGACYR